MEKGNNNSQLLAVGAIKKKKSKTKISATKAASDTLDMGAAKVGKGTGTRYSEERKKEIVDYMKSKGRGGLTAASKKYKVSMLSLSRWMKGPSKSGRKPGRPVGSTKLKSSSGSRTNSAPLFNARSQKNILKGLKRMSHGIEMLAQAFAHLT